jgi:hypothetical protein
MADMANTARYRWLFFAKGVAASLTPTLSTRRLTLTRKLSVLLQAELENRKLRVSQSLRKRELDARGKKRLCWEETNLTQPKPIERKE